MDTIHGFKALFAQSDISIAPAVVSDGTWEPSMTMTLNALLKEGDVYLDLGGNVGLDAI